MSTSIATEAAATAASTTLPAEHKIVVYGYNIPWTRTDLLIFLGPILYAFVMGAQDLIDHHRLSWQNLAALAVGTGILAAKRLIQYALKALDPNIHPVPEKIVTLTAPVDAVEVTPTT